eukprot:1160610-Pelagomonas_calceolata.AAC.9
MGVAFKEIVHRLLMCPSAGPSAAGLLFCAGLYCKGFCFGYLSSVTYDQHLMNDVVRRLMPVAAS